MTVMAKFRGTYSIFFVLVSAVFLCVAFSPLYYFTDLRFHFNTKNITINLLLNPDRNNSIRLIINEIDDWIAVSEDIFAYSAYLDARFKLPLVRIVGGICDKKHLKDLSCLLLHSQDSNSVNEIVPADFSIPGEHHGKTCKAAHLICRFQSQMTNESLVSLMLANSNMASYFKTSWMRVRNAEIPSDSKTLLAVCVRPLFNFTDSFRIAEFIAYHETLGVDHFIFYNYDTREAVLQFFMRLLVSNHSVELLPWSLPKEAQDMWQFGQIAGIQDCLYRNMHQYSHVMIVDVDEFATPRYNKTLKELIQHADSRRQNWNILYLRSSVFCLEAVEHFLNITPTFVTQNYPLRESYIYPVRDRSKFIIKPKSVVTGGIHAPLQMMNHENTAKINEKDVLLHHYRLDMCKAKRQHEIDITSIKYLKDLLVSDVIKIWTKLFNVTVS